MRFIPARAGNRAMLKKRKIPHKVHPRACGEQQSVATMISVLSGSSPRVRGTDYVVTHVVKKERFIPARAGNSTPTETRGTVPPVHPRACGEQGALSNHQRPRFGSPPRVRGTGVDRRPRHDQNRFIPARAGNSPVINAGSKVLTVHPRACGEQEHGRWMPKPADGSSPRVRGTARHYRGGDLPPRFIPARAGNS